MLDLHLLEPEVPRRISRAEYDRMVEMGMFADERVELIRGVIVAMTPINPPHCSPVDMLTEILVPALLGRARVRIQAPILAADDSEPEPDVAVVPIANYSGRHPDKAFLIIEVADSSLRKDRLVKAPLYAASGFEEYWIIDVAARTVEVHRGSTASGWASITTHVRAETLTVSAFPDVSVKIAEILL